MTNAQPMNMHTDVTDGSSAAQPMNMHTDVVVAKSGTAVVVTGQTDEAGPVAARLPRAVAVAVKARITPTRPARAPHAAGGNATVCVFTARAVVGDHPGGGLVISGPARVDGVKSSVALVITGDAFTALRSQHDSL